MTAPEKIKFLAALAILVCSPLACASPPPGTPGPVHHEIVARLDPAAGTIAASDRLTLPPGTPDWTLTLHAGLAPKVTAGEATLEPLGRDEHLERYRLTLAGPGPVTLTYSGTIRHGMDDIPESLGRAHQRTRGTIAEDGVFLDGFSGWYPRPGDGLHTFSLTVTVPQGWLPVSQGAGPDGPAAPVAAPNDKAGEVRVTWREDHPQDDIYLVAAPFTLYHRPTPVAEAQVYLRRPDRVLADRYLEATGTYLDLYSKLIGPYPYAKFALVENFWESGYGMPSFTLLGPQVIRLPFIVDTSYPHEILHNWWGNGVYVDYATGNWSEGLTAYLADHLVAERNGHGADYRRDALAGYANYVRRDKDFPLREFRGRHSSASQAIGYGKAMMFFHMLRIQLGDPAFIQGLQRFYADNRLRMAGYDDLRRAFEQTARGDLGAMFAAWTTRTGAPQVKLADLSVQEDPPGFRLTGRVEQTQDDPPFPLEVPLTIDLAGGHVREERVRLDQRSAGFDLHLPAQPLRVAADPSFDLFRTLADGEVPVTLSRLFGAERGAILWPSRAPPALAEGYRGLATAWATEHPGWKVRSDRDLDTLPPGMPIWLLGWENRHLAAFSAGADGFRLDPASQGLRILTGDQPPAGPVSPVLSQTVAGQPIAWLAVPDPAPLPGLARKLPHYGKYSYLVFSGDAPDIRVKGQWPAGDSELTVWLVQDRPLLPPHERAPLADQANAE